MTYDEGLQTAKANGIAGTTYSNRVNYYGWSIERAATTPTRKLGHVQALLREFCICKSTYYYWREYLPEGTEPRDIAEVAAARSRKREVANG